jgi:hypothetical protein
MRHQIWQLLKATEMGNVSLRMLPVTVEHCACGTGPFSIVDFPDQSGNTAPPTVYSENLTGAIYLDKPKELQAYEDAWAVLGSASLNEQETVNALSERLKELNDRER